MNVGDVNDMPPEFEFTDYQKEIPENAAVGSTVLAVRAFDKDTADITQVGRIYL